MIFVSTKKKENILDVSPPKPIFTCDERTRARRGFVHDDTLTHTHTYPNAWTNIFYEDLRIKSILYIWKFMAVIFLLAACPPFVLWAIDDNT